MTDFLGKLVIVFFSFRLYTCYIEVIDSFLLIYQTDAFVKSLVSTKLLLLSGYRFYL